MASRTGKRWTQVCSSAATLVLAASIYAQPTVGQGSTSTEYQVKAAFLFHFAQFVDWPVEAFKQADSPLIYCTLGGDPFHGVLDATLNGKTLGSRALQVRHLRKVAEAPGCHVLFIGAEEEEDIAAGLASLVRSPILTVGEAENFAAAGGMIGFCLEDNKVRFEINVGAAERANLKISARLLALAKTVIGRAKGN
jgi:hypothetical protein